MDPVSVQLLAEPSQRVDESAAAGGFRRSWRFVRAALCRLLTALLFHSSTVVGTTVLKANNDRLQPLFLC